MDSLETIKTDLRAKYLRDRDDLQRQVSSDPEQWTDEKMNEAVQKMTAIEELLKVTEYLTLSDSDESEPVLELSATTTRRLLEEICCPVCMDEMRSTIFCCSNSHPVCSVCIKHTDRCPTCRQNFTEFKPVRNRLAESLISAFLKK